MRRRDPSLTFRVESDWSPEPLIWRRIDIAPKVVCSPCNSGWMSELETAVKPFVAKAMRGQRHTLSKRRQELIATWSIMKVMSAEYLAAPGRDSYFTQAERSALYRTGRRPAGVVVWLGRSIRGEAGWAQDQDLTWTGDGGTVVRGYTVLFEIDELVVMVLSHRFRLGRRFESVNLPINFGPAAVQVWPILGKADWPPNMAFGSPSIEAWFDWWASDAGVPQVKVAPHLPAWDRSKG
jgi:hypothetical protein